MTWPTAHYYAHGIVRSLLCAACGCAAAALDETNDRMNNSKIDDQSFIRSEPILIYGDRYRIKSQY